MGNGSNKDGDDGDPKRSRKGSGKDQTDVSNQQDPAVADNNASSPSHSSIVEDRRFEKKQNTAIKDEVVDLPCSLKDDSNPSPDDSLKKDSNPSPDDSLEKDDCSPSPDVSLMKDDCSPSSPDDSLKGASTDPLISSNKNPISIPPMEPGMERADSAAGVSADPPVMDLDATMIASIMSEDCGILDQESSMRDGMLYVDTSLSDEHLVLHADAIELFGLPAVEKAIKLDQCDSLDEIMRYVEEKQRKLESNPKALDEFFNVSLDGLELKKSMECLAELYVLYYHDELEDVGMGVVSPRKHRLEVLLKILSGICKFAVNDPKVRRVKVSKMKEKGLLPLVRGLEKNKKERTSEKLGQNKLFLSREEKDTSNLLVNCGFILEEQIYGNRPPFTKEQVIAFLLDPDSMREEVQYLHRLVSVLDNLLASGVIPSDPVQPPVTTTSNFIGSNSTPDSSPSSSGKNDFNPSSRTQAQGGASSQSRGEPSSTAGMSKAAVAAMRREKNATSASSAMAMQKRKQQNGGAKPSSEPALSGGAKPSAFALMPQSRQVGNQEQAIQQGSQQATDSVMPNPFRTERDSQGRLIKMSREEMAQRHEMRAKDPVRFMRSNETKISRGRKLGITSQIVPGDAPDGRRNDSNQNGESGRGATATADDPNSPQEGNGNAVGNFWTFLGFQTGGNNPNLPPQDVRRLGDPNQSSSSSSSRNRPTGNTSGNATPRADTYRRSRHFTLKDIENLRYSDAINNRPRYADTWWQQQREESSEMKKKSGNYSTLRNMGYDPQYIGMRALDLTNDFRATHGLPPLKWNQWVCDVAREHAEQMAKGEMPFSHLDFNKRISKINTKVYTSSSAENLAYNERVSDPARVAVDGWIKSPGHCKNLLSLTNICGIGVAQTSTGRFYLTQLFGKTSGGLA